MGRILAIDYGQKRAGIAVTDELQLIPNALASLHVSEVMPFLKKYIAEEKVDLIVVGEPDKWIILFQTLKDTLVRLSKICKRPFRN